MAFAISDSSQIAQARRAATALGGAELLDETERGRLALVVTELATNILKHASGGELAIHTYDDPSGRGVEVITMDKGGGIVDIARAMQDGYSTAGTPGGGLGAIVRQSDMFEVFSRPGLGTVLMIRITRAKPTDAAMKIGAIVDPYPGEQICGDAWAFVSTPTGPKIIMADGSGHGPLAATAANLAVKVFREHAAETCTEIMQRIHSALKPTRGAAVAIAEIDEAARLVRFVGVGNITGASLAGVEVKRLVSNNGTAGHLSPRIRAFDYPYAATPSILLHSDGLTSKWDLAAYPGLLVAHPSLVAGVLFRDFRRGRDDASVAVLRGG